MLSVFIDTLLICSATAFMILCSGIDSSAFIDEAGKHDERSIHSGFADSNFGVFGGLSSLRLLHFSHLLLSWKLFYAEMNISYLYKNALDNKPFMVMYRLLAVLGNLPFGAQFSAGLAWDTADVLMGFMALINVPVCIILGNTAFK